MKDQTKEFEKERSERIIKQGRNKKLKEIALQFTIDSLVDKYSYNFSWLGRPIIQHPQDIVAVQELIWQLRPDLIIETGIAHGGSLILSASILELIGGDGLVVGVDIDIRKHNKKGIEKHPMAKRIKMIQGSSIAPEIVSRVKELARSKKRVIVFLDSNHAHDHVLRELELYSPLVTKNSYLVVFDTIVEDMPKKTVKDRPWDKGSNPRTAVNVFIKKNKNFVLDKSWENKLLITAAPGGWLKRIK